MSLAVIFRGATIVPGDGPAFVGDVGIDDGRIALVARGGDPGAEGAEVVDGGGLLLCPGFVDLHTHSALAPFADPLLTPKLAQGFTTEVLCPDGLAPAPVERERWHERRDYLRPLEGPGPAEWTWSTFAEYLDALDETRPALSLVASAGHGAVRDLVVGSTDRPPDDAELGRMRVEVRACLDEGARMVSFGLVYLPGAHAATEELVAVAEIAGAAGVPIVPHVRNEGHGLLDAVDEMIEVAVRSGAALHVSHLKSLADETLVGPLLERLETAGDELPVTFDQYPYGAGSTLLASVLPSWAQEGGAAGTLARLGRASDRARIHHDVEHGLAGWENLLGTLGPERIEIANAAEPRADAVGHTLADLAANSPSDELSLAVDAALDLLLDTGLDVTMILHYASDAAVRAIAAHPLQLVGSDGIFGARPHPRLYGTAPRFLGRFCLREGLLPLEEAVARLTSRAAALLGLRDRGRIAEGLRADLVLLDPTAYVDTATYADPCRTPPGVRGVWVAGRCAWRGGAPTGARAGGVVR
jgi:N-acyl-D-amino-acid deacylase